MPDVADKTGAPEAEVIELLSEALSSGLIKGNFDRTTGEFFTLDSLMQEMKFKLRPSCGAQLNRIYYREKTIECTHCGILITE